MADRSGPQGGGLPAGPRRAATAVRSCAITAAMACAAALTAAGCTMVPASGSLNQLVIPQTGGGQNQENPQLLPVGPVPGWNQVQIVNGFLAANASFASDPSVALEYLIPNERSQFHPDGAVTVVGNLQPSRIVNVPERQVLPTNPETTVQVTGVQLATLTRSGQYITSQSSAPSKTVYTFHLTKYANQWRIDKPFPTSQLMLTTDELERAYQQRNLYFLAPDARALVPDPVYVPQNETDSGLAMQLVNGLRKNPQGWLSGATQTAFPPDTSLLSLKINGPDATVDLGMSPAAAQSLKVKELAAQLVWTLTSTSYGPSDIQFVELQINGHTKFERGTQYLLPKMYENWIPGAPLAAGPYFISRDGSVQMVAGAGQPGSVTSLPSRPVPGPAGTAKLPAFAMIAVAPGQASLAGVSADGRTIYIGDLGGNAPLTANRPGGIVTSLSWDRTGHLWFSASGSIWMLTPTTGAMVQTLGLPAGDQVTALRVAPDGVRIAMIVKTGSGSAQLLVAAIIHTGASASIGQAVTMGAGITDPQELSWYDADHLIVLAGQRSGAQLKVVPLDGGQPSLIGTQSGTVSVTGDGAGLAAGLSDGHLYVSPSLSGSWEPVKSAGHDPVFPG
jgi:hypothetical protein